MLGERGCSSRKHLLPLTPGSSRQNKSWYRAKHHASGQGGLLAAGAPGAAEALLRRTPSSASAPYVSRGSALGRGWGQQGPASPTQPALPPAAGGSTGRSRARRRQQLQPPEDGLFLVRESAWHPGTHVPGASFSSDVIHYRVLHRRNAGLDHRRGGLLLQPHGYGGGAPPRPPV